VFIFYAGNYYEKVRKAKESPRPKNVSVVFEIAQNCLSSGKECISGHAVYTEYKMNIFAHFTYKVYLIQNAKL
jgi:hypothetical protein